MKEQTITLTQEELERTVYEEVQKERHILFDLPLEDYFLLPEITEQKGKGKTKISMTEDVWKNHIEDISQMLGNLMLAHELIKMMEPVYKEYHALYESEHGFDFDDYMRMIVTAYDADEFERVRDMFEEEYYKRLDGNEEER